MQHMLSMTGWRSGRCQQHMGSQMPLYYQQHIHTQLARCMHYTKQGYPLLRTAPQGTTLGPTRSHQWRSTCTKRQGMAHEADTRVSNTSTTTDGGVHYLPGVGTHAPAQAAVCRPVTEPYWPAGHTTYDVALYTAT